MKKKAHRVLGRGLEALFTENKIKSQAQAGDEVQKLDMDRIVPHPDQPRKKLDRISELSESIKLHGVLQPIIVLEQGDAFQIIAGERRWRAARMAGLKKIPAIIKTSLSSRDKLEIALIENVHRQDLNVMEEARAYHKLVENFHLTIEKVGQMVGRDRSTVSNTLRLLTLPKEIQEDLSRNILTPGHVRPLINLPDEKTMLRIRERIVKQGLSARQVEKAVQALKKEDRAVPKGKPLDRDLKEIKEKLQTKLSTKVSIIGGLKKGKIILEYYSQEELERIMEILDL
jgi:ParB family chromosome partitioning protein